MLNHGRFFYILFANVVSLFYVETYLRCIEDELPDRPITGFRYETLTDAPAVRKGVDDILFNLCGEENPRQLEDYETPDQGMKMGGM